MWGFALREGRMAFCCPKVPIIVRKGESSSGESEKLRPEGVRNESFMYICVEKAYCERLGLMSVPSVCLMQETILSADEKSIVIFYMGVHCLYGTCADID